jgi:hypothetical protein
MQHCSTVSTALLRQLLLLVLLLLPSCCCICCVLVGVLLSYTPYLPIDSMLPMV